MNLEKLAGCLIIENDKVLLIKEKKDMYWKLLSGKIEEGETVEQCAIREAKKEGNIDVKLLGLFNKYTFNFKNRNFELTVYEARIVNGNPRVTEAHLEAVDWFSIQFLNNDSTPLDKLIYQDLVRRNRK
ncbi:NUDIX domain-containing protein [Candidatus Pacearchaeota archaeon]|nr:NUDIX domain-containing protein [Candidatus Pacearchaeota archaeon]